MEAFTAEGEWWLPERRDRKVGGVLHFDPTDGSSLAMIGSFRAWHERGTRSENGRVVTFGEDDMERSGVYPIVHGQVGATAYTLVDCFQTKSTNTFGGLGTEAVHANQVFRGAWFDSEGELVATAASFSIWHLAYWVGMGGLAQSLRFRRDRELDFDAPWVTLTATPVPDVMCAAPDGTLVTLRQVLGWSGPDVRHGSVTQDVLVKLERTGTQPLRSFVDTASDFQDLVSIAVNRTAAFEAVSFFHPDIEHQRGSGEAIPIPINYFVQWKDQESRSDKEEVHHHEMLFSFDELGGIAGVEKWLGAAARHRTALGRVMSTRYQRSMYSSDRLLNYAAALEAFDRTRNGKARMQFKARMNRCIDLAGPPFDQLVGDRPTWLRLLTDARNDAAHHLERRVLGGTEQYLLAESAFWLFALCMLRAADAPDIVFEHAQNHGSYRWLCRALTREM